MRIGKVSETSRRCDLEFWRREGFSSIFATAWEIVVEAYGLKRKSKSSRYRLDCRVRGEGSRLKGGCSQDWLPH